MTKLDALKELAEKIENGTATRKDFHEGFGSACQDLEYQTRVENAAYAFKGSLDSAMALQDAVLSLKFGYLVGPAFVSIPNEFGVSVKVYSIKDKPARAWLLAIVLALIVEEESK